MSNSLVPAQPPVQKYQLWTPVIPYTHPTLKERDAQAEFLGLIKTALINTIHNINFADPVQTRRAHETLMHDVNREAQYISNKYSMQIDPLYFEWDKFIPT